MYPLALDCGVSVSSYWNMSLAEIRDCMESFERKHRMEFKQKVSELHVLAKDIAQYVSAVLNGSDGNPPPELWDYFPDLFGEEKKEANKRIQDHMMAVYKAQMQDYAYRHNRKRDGGEKS